jgi:hypothetical protein
MARDDADFIATDGLATARRSILALTDESILSIG